MIYTIKKKKQALQPIQCSNSRLFTWRIKAKEHQPGHEAQLEPNEKMGSSRNKQ